MGNRLTTQKDRPICIICNIRKCKKNGVTIDGFIKYKKYCTTCNKSVYNEINDSGRCLGYMLKKKDKCEICDFVPTNISQLDVDHIDGNSSNNEDSNLQTLCANCHRLKTYNDNLAKFK